MVQYLESKSSIKKPAYYPALTGLRALVALLVFFFHATGGLVAEKYIFPVKWLIRVLQQGSVGVSIFFMLSGFLITIRYGQNIQLTAPWFRRYLQNRFARIYPIYFLLTALAFGVMVVHPSFNWYQWPKTFSPFDKLVALGLNLTLTRAFFEKMVFLGVPTAWSLTVEECFYVAAPFLLVGLRLRLRRLLLYPIVLLLIGTLLVYFCSHFLPYYGLLASMSFMLTFTFFGRSAEFIVGIWLAFKVMDSGHVRAQFPGATLLGGLGLVAIMLLVPTITHALSVLPLGQVVLSLLFSVPIALLLWGLVQERTWLQRLLQTKAFDLLGKSSYIFYLIHLGIIDTLFTRFVTENWAARLLAYTLLSIGLYCWVERPLHSALRAKSKPATKPAQLLVDIPVVSMAH